MHFYDNDEWDHDQWLLIQVQLPRAFDGMHSLCERTQPNTERREKIMAWLSEWNEK